MLATTAKRRAPAPTQCTTKNISAPKFKRKRLQGSPQYNYPVCGVGNAFTAAQKSAGAAAWTLNSFTSTPVTPWPASQAASPRCIQMESKCPADELVASTSALNLRGSAINSRSSREVEIKGSAYSDGYKTLSSKTCAKIHDYLRRGVKTFWLQNDTDACSYLFDFESMQRHNISTGYRRSIRFRDQEPSCIDLTDDSNALDSPSYLSAVNKNTNCTVIIKKQAVNVCGPAFEGNWVCGAMAEKKLAKIRQLNLQRSPLIREISQLPECQQVFDPVPISPCDERFPIEQIKHLNFGGLTVHKVRPTRMWKRNRSHFDLLLEEEKEFFSAYKQPNKNLKLVHWAWHGAPAKSISGILECGFLSVPSARVGRVYGHGIYLSTEQHAQYSKRDRFSAPDSEGFKYLLLCEVLPGSAEVSEKGQTHPSSKVMHSGVDRMPSPSMHIFYTYDMNVRISPKYVVCIHPEVTKDILNNICNEKNIF